MIYIRSLLYYLIFAPSTIIIAMLVLLGRLFGRDFSWWVSRLWGWWSDKLLRAFCGINFVVEGLENIPKTPCVVVCKHQSTWETTTLPVVLPPFAWVLKKELMAIPFFGWALYALGAIPIVRSNPRDALKQVIEKGTAQLKSGRFIVIFPEGTRVDVGETGNYQPSAMMLAKKAEVAILPVAHNAGLCWPRGTILKYPGTITIRVLPAISAEDVQAGKRNDLLSDCETRIEAACRDLGA